MAHDIVPRGSDGIAGLTPFGLGQQKPHHVLEMFEVLWENRDSLPYAWRILDQGVCDGCSLGPKGLKDDVVEGIHLCTTRLKLLRLNTMPYALVTPDGTWHQHGQMGWWGMSSDEMDAEDWDDRVMELMEKHRDSRAVVCDLHI